MAERRERLLSGWVYGGVVPGDAARAELQEMLARARPSLALCATFWFVRDFLVCCVLRIVCAGRSQPPTSLHPSRPRPVRVGARLPAFGDGDNAASGPALGAIISSPALGAVSSSPAPEFDARGGVLC